MQRFRITLLLTLVGMLFLTIGTNPAYAGEALPLQGETEVTKDTGADAAYDITPLAAETTNRLGAGEVYQGDNPAQTFDILFSPNGLDVQNKSSQSWQWTLRMLSYGYGDAQVSSNSTSTVIQRNRIEFHRGDLVEWYINSKEGIEQGFTLQNAPAGRQAGVPLVVSLALNSNLTPELSSDNQTIDFYGSALLPVLRYAKLVVTDANGSVVPAYFVVSEGRIDIVIDDSQAVYPLTIDPLLTSFLTKKVADDAEASDEFGYSVHTSGNTAVIGAYKESSSKGAVYTFELNGAATDWDQTDKVTGSDSVAGDEFGKSAFVTGGIMMVSGAAQHNSTKGAAYIFERDAITPTQWVEITKLSPISPTAGDKFGAAVSADTLATLADAWVVVGAPGDNSGQGAAYLYARDAITHTQFNQVKKLTADDGAAGDDFGTSVYMAVDTVFVGAPGDDSGQGAVYVFQRDEGGADNWGQVTKLTASDGAAGDIFGESLSYTSFSNAKRIIVGAPKKNTGAGGAYIFKLPTTGGGTPTWAEEKILTASNSTTGYQYGISVAMSSNYAIVGSRFDATNGSDAGSAFLLFRNKGGSSQWGELAHILPSDGTTGDQFGHSVAIRGSDVVIGARTDDPPNNSGSAYFYKIPQFRGTMAVDVNVQPDDPATEWKLSIDGLLEETETFMGDGGIVTETFTTGTYTVTLEANGAGTSLGDYVVTHQCTVNGVSGSSASGSEFTVLISKNDVVSCVFTLSQRGSIVIAKVTDPVSSTLSFDFTSNISGTASFTLTNSITKTISGLAPGTYAVTETVPAGWILQDLVCDDGASASPSSGDTATGEATIKIEAGETVTCTYTNQQLATVVIKNVTIPSGGTGYVFTDTIGSGTFILDDGGTETFSDKLAGQYKVRRLAAGDLPLADITCDDSGSTIPSTGDVGSGIATINAEPGETVTCTFTNAESLPDVGTIKIIKVTDPSGGAGFSFTDDIPGSGSFSLDDGDGGKTFTNVPVGTYAVTEDAKDGWDLTNLVCTDPSSDSSTDPSTATATIKLAKDETVVCTFTNTEQVPEPGTIVIKKITNPSGGSDFAFTHNIPGAGGFSLNDGEMKTFADVAAGTYTITESVKSGWELNGITCDDSDSTKDMSSRTATVIVAAGETVTCTFTNAEQGVSVGSIIIEKSTTPATGTGFAFVDNIPGSSGSFSLDHGGTKKFSDIAPGTYKVTETAKDGWMLKNILCSDPDGGSVSSVPSSIATIDLDAGETVHCVFQSEEIPSSNPAIELTTTVGTESDSCATTDTLDDVAPGTKVYYCYSVKNTGDVTLTVHSLVDDQLGTIFNGVSFTLSPGATVTNIDLGKPATAEITTATTNTATWKAKESASSTTEVGDQSSATVTVKASDPGGKIYLPNIYK